LRECVRVSGSRCEVARDCLDARYATRPVDTNGLPLLGAL
jgi:hypothetical protein